MYLTICMWQPSSLLFIIRCFSFFSTVSASGNGHKKSHFKQFMHLCIIRKKDRFFSNYIMSFISWKHVLQYWCSLFLILRCNMDVSYSQYQAEILKWKLGPDGHKKVGCLHQPLFEILLSNIVTDELHLMLRVMDRLETGLILKDVDRDEVNYIFRCLII